MPSLDFKGKSFIYTHHLGVPYRELLVVPEKSCPAEGRQPDLDDNLILKGDNLEALKALLPRYAGKVDCIYIDPPYNTGTEGWCYNDAVNAPLMREWLKKEGNPVDRDDLQRHDKWLCMMWPRLQLLKDLLAEDGAIFVSIDDNEVHRLRAVMDEIFGEENFVACMPWKGRGGRQGALHFADIHEFVLLYAKDKQNLAVTGLETDLKYPCYDAQKKRHYKTQLLRKWGNEARREDRQKMWYGIPAPDGTEAWPKLPDGTDGRWRWKKSAALAALETEDLQFEMRDSGWVVYEKIYAPEDGDSNSKKAPTWLDAVGTTADGSKTVTEIFGRDGFFDYPKPVSLLEHLLSRVLLDDGLVLDSFAGSGTTAHAVIKMNEQDNGQRRFILIQMPEVLKSDHPGRRFGWGEVIELTAERVRRVIRGYDYSGTQETALHPPENVTWTTFAKDMKRNEILERIEATKTLDGANYDNIETKIKDGVLTVVGKKTVEKTMPGLGGSFTYLELGEAMDLERLLAETPGTLPSFPALARYLFFTATGHTLPATATPAMEKKKPAAKAKGKAKAQPASETAAPDAPVLIGETAVWRIYLHYVPEEAWLRSPAAAFTRTQAEAIAAESKGSGKQALVFAAAKFINHRSLRELKVDFAQLPYALHRVQAE